MVTIESVAASLHDFLATVETVSTYVVATMSFASGSIGRQSDGVGINSIV
jgi:hypothetical protein|tara:strand:- start:3173 stop:3322 length:150 start_codon:yes stop_codon:yes gene_type:complete